MRTFLLLLLGLFSLSAYAQTSLPYATPAAALSQLEDLKELTKHEALTSMPKGRVHAEVNPELNRWLVISADDFVRITMNNPTKEAYLSCLDRDLTRISPLLHDAESRQQVADFYEELVEIVGLDSSEGRLLAFVGGPSATASTKLPGQASVGR